MVNSAVLRTFIGSDLPRLAKITMQLAKRDFQTRYKSSTLGIVWMLLQPLAMMLTLWLVFAYGLKIQASHGQTSYAVWFFAAMIAWNFISEALVSGSSAVLDYGFLIKKVRFEAGILPLVKVLSSLMVHGIFLVLLLVIAVLSNVPPTWSWLSLPLFTLWACLFAAGISYMTASINLFFRDCGQIIGIILQFGFWTTPIVWDFKMLPEKLHWVIKLNPVSYLTEGYRNSLIYGKSFWEFNPLQATYAWLLGFLVLGLGWFTFNKLRPHFGDVL